MIARTGVPEDVPGEKIFLLETPTAPLWTWSKSILIRPAFCFSAEDFGADGSAAAPAETLPIQKKVKTTAKILDALIVSRQNNPEFEDASAGTDLHKVDFLEEKEF